MPDPSKIDGYNWRRHKTDALRFLAEIAKNAKQIRRTPHVGPEKATDIATTAAAVTTAIAAMDDIARGEMRRLRQRIEELEKEQPPDVR